MQRAGLGCGERGLNAEPQQVGDIPEQRGLAPARRCNSGFAANSAAGAVPIPTPTLTLRLGKSAGQMLALGSCSLRRRSCGLGNICWFGGETQLASKASSGAIAPGTPGVRFCTGAVMGLCSSQGHLPAG